MRVLLISYHFGNSSEVGAQRPTALALHLARMGASVDVLCCGPEASVSNSLNSRITVYAIPNQRGKLMAGLVGMKRLLLGRERNAVDAQPRKASHGIDKEAAERGGLLGWVRAQMLTTALLFDGCKRWLVAAARLGVKLGRFARYDIIVSSGPPMAAHIAATYVGWRSGTRVNLDMRDPWTLDGGWGGSKGWAGRINQWFMRWCFRHAAIVTCASPGLVGWFDKRVPGIAQKITVVYNGYDDSDVIDTAAPTGRLQMQYAGSLYLNRNPFPLFESIARLIASGRIVRSSIALDLIGDCKTWRGQDVLQNAQRLGLDGVVRTLPQVTRKELVGLMGQANVLVNFAQGQREMIPAKTYQYLAAHRDVLIITEPDSDTAGIIAKAGVGYCVEDKDTEKMDDAIYRLYTKYVLQPGAAGFLGASDVEQFSRRLQNTAWMDLLEKTSGSAALIDTDAGSSGTPLDR